MNRISGNEKYNNWRIKYNWRNRITIKFLEMKK